MQLRTFLFVALLTLFAGSLLGQTGTVQQRRYLEVEDDDGVPVNKIRYEIIASGWADNEAAARCKAISYLRTFTTLDIEMIEAKKFKNRAFMIVLTQGQAKGTRERDYDSSKVNDTRRWDCRDPNNPKRR